ncbi:MAG: hypothetical protein R2762_02275 [Bryobacteraceae bacterium]
MRYWAYLLAKLAAAWGLLFALWTGMHALWPEPEPFMRVRLQPFARDLGYTAAVMLFGLAAVGVVYLIVLDQRFRCRTCLRRLRMPVTRGSWNQLVLMGPPRTEYICPFGHGTLRVPDLHLESPEKPDWHPIDDMWKELAELQDSHK